MVKLAVEPVALVLACPVLLLAACDRSSPAGAEGSASKPPPAAPAPTPPVPAPAAAAPALASAATPSPSPLSAPPVTLVLTWMPPDQPPQTTQTGFRDLASCERARAEAIAESRRLASETAAPARPAGAAAERRYVGNTLISGAPPPPPTAVPVPPPKVAAICAGG